MFQPQPVMSGEVWWAWRQREQNTGPSSALHPFLESGLKNSSSASTSNVINVKGSFTSQSEPCARLTCRTKSHDTIQWWAWWSMFHLISSPLLPFSSAFAFSKWAQPLKWHSYLNGLLWLSFATRNAASCLSLGTARRCFSAIALAASLLSMVTGCNDVSIALRIHLRSTRLCLDPNSEHLKTFTPHALPAWVWGRSAGNALSSSSNLTKDQLLAFQIFRCIAEVRAPTPTTLANTDPPNPHLSQDPVVCVAKSR